MATTPAPTTPAPDFDLVVVGLGSAGITAVEFAVGLGLRVAAVERARPGGDCLWTGCVPSKAIIASARAAHVMRTADRLGLSAVEPQIDLAKVWRRARAVQADIARTDDDPRHFIELGVEFVVGSARLTSPNEVAVTQPNGEVRNLSSRFVLLCTGSTPVVPAIEGLPADQCLTSENVFGLDSPPNSLAIIGGGAMGTELAQAFVRLGMHVALFERLPSLLASEEPSLVERLTAVIEHEGVAVHCSADVRHVSRGDDGAFTVHAVVGDDAHEVTVTAAAVLVAVGRAPAIAELGLEEVGVEFGPDGVVVDERGRTSLRTVYAAGDIVGGHHLTNAAGHGAVMAVRDMFFPGKAGGVRLVPWCTFTDPELAHIGLTSAEAEDLHGAETDVWFGELATNDRARTDARTEGAVVIVTAKGKVVGAHVLAPGAGEVVHELALAVREGLRIDELAGLVHVYPTFASSIGRLATEAAYERAQRLKWMVKKR